MVNNIFLYKRFIGVKKINGHSGVNFSFKVSQIKETLPPVAHACDGARSLESATALGKLFPVRRDQNRFLFPSSYIAAMLVKFVQKFISKFPRRSKNL